MGKRELIALLNLSSWCLVMVERLFLAVPRGCLQFVIVVFPDHTHLLFLVCELLTWMGRATALFFGPALWGPGEVPKGQISLNIIKFQLQSQFQRFFNQTLCVFSHMKDIKHIRRDFHLAAWVMPHGWDLGVPRGLGASIFFLRNSTRFGV